jgi:ABC-type sugar transport system substrate-binding protein
MRCITKKPAYRAPVLCLQRAVSVLIASALIILINCGCSHPASGIGPKTVAIVTPARSNWFNTELIEGARQEAALLGWNPVQFYSPPGDADDSALAQLALDAIKKKPDAISVCGLEVNKLTEVVHAANLAGVPIFVHNQLDPAGGKVEAYIGYDEYEAGKQCGNAALELLKKHGKNDVPEGQVAIIEGTPGTHNDRRVAGFRDVLKFSEHVNIVEEKGADWSKDLAQSLTANWLKSHPDIYIIFTCNDAMARGAARAAAEAHKDVKVIGYGGSQDGLFGVKAGYMNATLATNPKKMGGRIVHVMMDVFGNSGVVKPGQTVTTDTLLVNMGNVDAYMGGFAEVPQEQPKQDKPAQSP